MRSSSPAPSRAGRARARRGGSDAIPLPALVLGLGGLIPFAFGAAMVWCPVPVMAEHGVILLGRYGAVILSFLGGVRWGRLLVDDASLARWWPLTLSILPSLAAWVALLLPETALFAVLAMGFILQYLVDRDAVESNRLPGWYGRLRLILTTGATLAIVSGLLQQLMPV